MRQWLNGRKCHKITKREKDRDRDRDREIEWKGEKDREKDNWERVGGRWSEELKWKWERKRGFSEIYKE